MATPTGEQQIGTLKVGEQVLAYDPQTGQNSSQTVQHVFINHDNDLIDLTLRTDDAPAASTDTKPKAASAGAPHGRAPPLAPAPSQTPQPLEETVHTTAKHPFLTVEQGWVTAGRLQPGMHVLRADGHVGVVEAVQVVPGAGTMYNLKVSRVHTFEVGLGQWVVHNCGGDPPGNWEKDELNSTDNISAFNHVDAKGKRIEVGFYHDTGELQIGWTDTLNGLKRHLPGLVDWLGDSVKTVRGYVSTRLEDQVGKYGVNGVRRMFNSILSSRGFDQGVESQVGSRHWLTFSRNIE